MSWSKFSPGPAGTQPARENLRLIQALLLGLGPLGGRASGAPVSNRPVTRRAINKRFAELALQCLRRTLRTGGYRS